MKLSIVLSTQPAQFQAATFKGDLEENLSQIASLGYDGVELAIRDSKLVDLKTLESLVRKYNLHVPAIGTGQAWGEEGLSFTDPDPAIRRNAIERIKSHIPVASRFGALLIIGLIRGIIRPGVDASQAMDWLVAALRECSGGGAASTASAWPWNRSIAMKPLLSITPGRDLELIERVGAENFGLLLDTFHMNIEEPVMEESISRCGKHIFHFHVADSNRWYPGAGHLDFKSILNELFTTGYEGWVSGEFIPMPDAAIAAQQSLTLLRKLG